RGVAHHGINIVAELVSQAREGLVFLGAGIEENLIGNGLVGGERQRRIDQGGFKAHRSQRVSCDQSRFVAGGPGQVYFTRDDIYGGLLRHGDQREELIVRGDPNHVARAGAIFGWWYAWDAG